MFSMFKNRHVSAPSVLMGAHLSPDFLTVVVIRRCGSSSPDLSSHLHTLASCVSSELQRVHGLRSGQHFVAARADREPGCKRRAGTDLFVSRAFIRQHVI